MATEINNKIYKFIRQNIIFIILFSIIISLELFSFNADFFNYHLHNLTERNLQVSNAALSGFDQTNGKLEATIDDPNLTFPMDEERVRFIKLDCTNFDPEAFSQIYYRSWMQGFKEVNSVIFSLSSQEAEITLPRTVKLSNLRFDLTNQKNDLVFCQEITINPEKQLNFSYLRLGLLLLSSVGFVFGNKIISNKSSKIIWEFVIQNGTWIFIVLIILISTAYPLTLTVDSAHYLWLADLIKQANWENWDPFRNIGFPLQIFFSSMLFLSGRDAALIPMIIARVILFYFSSMAVCEIFKAHTKNRRLMVHLFIFVFIIMDPTIFGYYQTILTEYVAATIAMVSIFMAIKLYRAPLFSKRFTFLSTYFLVMSLWSWHLKQDYVGAALFPFMIIVFLIVLKNFSWKSLAYFLLSISTISLLILFSTIAWNNYLLSQENPMDLGRDVTLMAGDSLDSQIGSIQTDFGNYLRLQLFNYFRAINFWVQDQHQPLNEFSLTYGFQNRLVAHRIFLNLPAPNLIHDYPLFDPYLEPFAVRFAPHEVINFIFKSRINISHFFFTSTYLVLPIFTLLLFILWIHKKTLINAALLVLAGTSLLNALIHLLTGIIDRYLFLGYPLNLLIFTVLIIEGGKIFYKLVSKKKGK
jgi:hypothetical protein